MPALPSIDEDTHQALDLLESLEGVGALWDRLEGRMPTSAEDPRPEAAELLQIAEREDVPLAELAPAHARVSAMLARYVPAAALNLLDALTPLVDSLRTRTGAGKAILRAAAQASGDQGSSGDRELRWMDATRSEPMLALLQDDEAAGSLDDAALSDHLEARVRELAQRVNALRQAIEADPETAWAFAPAIAATTRNLAVPRDSLVAAILRRRASAAGKNAAAEQVGVVTSRWLRAAYLKTVAPDRVSDGPTASALARFRNEATREGAQEIRAQALSADLPDRIDIARKVAARARGPEAIEAFAQAVEAARRAERDEGSPHRRFTWMHVALVAAIVALTVWHYYLR